MVSRSLALVALSFFALLGFVPAATAQVDGDSFSVTATAPEVLLPTGSNAVPFNVTLACTEIVEQGGEADVSVAPADMPAGVQADPVSLHFGIESCAGAVDVTQSGELQVTATNATGLELFEFVVEATLGDHGTTARYPDRWVAYLPGHSLSPDGDQEFEVAGSTFTFDLEVVVSANAETMVMFEDKVVSGTATLTGLRAKIFDVEGGETTETTTITFTPPTGPWQEETVQFRNYSHCLGNSDCAEEGERIITWTFVNVTADAGVPVDSEASTTGEASAVPGIPVFLVVVAAAGLARWRR